MASIKRASFTGGELAPALYARADMARYQSGLKVCRNWFVRREGGISNRAGMEFVCPLIGFGNGICRLIPFVFNNAQSYTLVFQDGRLFFIRSGFPILEASKTITGITAATPPVVTAASHGYSDGDLVYIEAVAGMTQVNSRFFQVDSTGANTFELMEEADVVGAGYTAYTSGGTAKRIYSIVSPYAEEDLAAVRFVQSADVLTLTHPDYPPHNLSRVSDTSWTLAAITFDPAIAPPEDGSASGTAGSETVRYRVTAVAEDTTEESFAGTGTPVDISSASSTGPSAQNAITGITVATPPVVTSNAHGYSNGDFVLIENVVGMVEINGRYFSVAGVTANTFELNDEDGNPVDGSGYTAYSSGGTASEVFELSFTTATNHNLNTNDEASFDGFTTGPFDNYNDGVYIVRKMSATVFRLKRQYGGLTVSVGSEGDVFSTSITRTSVTFPTSSNPVTVSWSAVPGALEYNIYREVNGIYGYVGTSVGTEFEDLGYTVDPSDTPPIQFDVFAAAGDYPAAVGYYQQRKLYGGPENDPERIRASRTGLYNNFTKSNPIQEDDSISWVIASNQVNAVRHFVELENLFVFTQGAEWTIQGDDAGTLTTQAINPRKRSENGIGDVPPIVASNAILYVQYQGNVINQLTPGASYGAFDTRDLTVFSPHLFEGSEVIDWAYAKVPYSIVWAVRSDGVMLGLTYLREQEVWGWHRHDTGDGDEFTGVCCIPEGVATATYASVTRYDVNGQTRTYIERMADRYTTRAAEARFLDSFRTYDALDSLNANAAATFTLSYSPGSSPTDGWALVASGVGNAVFVTGESQIGRLIVLDLGASGRLLCRVLTVISTTAARISVTGTFDSWFEDDGSPGDTFPVATNGTYVTDDWAEGATAIGGMWHAEGREVTALVDGYPAGPFTVDNGAITLPEPASYVHVGLAIEADAEPLDPDFPDQESLSDKYKSVSKATLMVEATSGLQVGADSTHLNPEGSQKFVGTTVDGLRTGRLIVQISGKTSMDGTIFIRQSAPLPATVSGFVSTLSAGRS